jgi:hypothetical protein
MRYEQGACHQTGANTLRGITTLTISGTDYWKRSTSSEHPFDNWAVSLRFRISAVHACWLDTEREPAEVQCERGVGLVKSLNSLLGVVTGLLGGVTGGLGGAVPM